VLGHCPGSANLRTPSLAVKQCPQCGAEVEVFSNDVSVACPGCDFTVYNDLLSCVQWCKYAKQCVGEEVYRKLVEKREG